MSLKKERFEIIVLVLIMLIGLVFVHIRCEQHLSNAYCEGQNLEVQYRTYLRADTDKTLLGTELTPGDRVTVAKSRMVQTFHIMTTDPRGGGRRNWLFVSTEAGETGWILEEAIG